MAHTVTRYHDISCGHRVRGHEGKCAHLHGHNYRMTFTCMAAANTKSLDHLGRVLDFGEIKTRLCMWLEDEWDHKMLIWKHDPIGVHLRNVDPTVVLVPFNPTAENMAEHLVMVVGPQQLEGTDIVLVHCTVEETRKCSASYQRDSR